MKRYVMIVVALHDRHRLLGQQLRALPGVSIRIRRADAEPALRLGRRLHGTGDVSAAFG